MNADGGAAALERFCILAKNYKGRGLAETIQQVSFTRGPLASVLVRAGGGYWECLSSICGFPRGMVRWTSPPTFNMYRGAP
jgi:hypothetical protein